MIGTLRTFIMILAAATVLLTFAQGPIAERRHKRVCGTVVETYPPFTRGSERTPTVVLTDSAGRCLRAGVTWNQLLACQPGARVCLDVDTFTYVR